MFRLMNLALLLSPFWLLWYTNPTFEDFVAEAKSRVSAEQSTARAGWSFLSKITGINAISKAAGAGNYEVCHHDFTFFSLFTVRDAKLLDSSRVRGAAIGVVGNFLLTRSRDEESAKGTILKKGVDQLMTFSADPQCRKVHKDGELSLG